MALHHLPAAASALPSIPTGVEGLISNASIVILFGAMIGAGIMKGVKEVREFRKGTTTDPAKSIEAQVAAVTILENATLSAWTRSNKEVVEVLERTCEQMSHNRDEMQEQRRGLVELRYVMTDLTAEMRKMREDGRNRLIDRGTRE